MQARWLLLLGLFGCNLGCNKAKHYTTPIQIVHVQRFSADGKTGLIEIEARFSDCPGVARRVMRIDKDHTACLGDLQPGQTHKVEVVSSYSSERSLWRSDVLKIDDCPITLDPKEEANFETFENCTDLKASGAVVGITCERQRSPEVLAKCPFLRRR